MEWIFDFNPRQIWVISLGTYSSTCFDSFAMKKSEAIIRKEEWNVDSKNYRVNIWEVLRFLISCSARRRCFSFASRCFDHFVLWKKENRKYFLSLFMLVQLIMFPRFFMLHSSKTTASFHWSFLILFMNINANVCVCFTLHVMNLLYVIVFLNWVLYGCRKTKI